MVITTADVGAEGLERVAGGLEHQIAAGGQHACAGARDALLPHGPALYWIPCHQIRAATLQLWRGTLRALVDVDRQQLVAHLCAGLGHEGLALNAESGAILPLVVMPDTGTTVILYREQDGLLYERRYSAEGQLSAAARVSDIAVVTDAVDSEQVGADLIRHGASLHLLFIDARTRSIFHTRSDLPGVWSAAEPVIEEIKASWVRGSVHADAEGKPVYGFIYDGGSEGGSGFNRYHAIAL